MPDLPWQTLVVIFGSGFAAGGLFIRPVWLHTLLALAIIGLGAYLLRRAGRLG